MTDNCIVVEQLIKLAKLKYDNLLEVVRLYSPVLLHHRCHSAQLVLWHKQRVWIIHYAISWRMTILVLDVFRLDEPRQMSIVFVINLSVL